MLREQLEGVGNNGTAQGSGGCGVVGGAEFARSGEAGRVVLTNRFWWSRLRAGRRIARRKLSNLPGELGYEMLDRRLLLSTSSANDGTVSPPLFELPPEVSAMISSMIANGSTYSSNVWRPNSNSSYSAPETWDNSNDPNSFAPEYWRSYSATGGTAGTTVSTTLASTPINGGGQLAFVRKATVNRSVSGGNAAGGLDEGFGGLPLTETVGTTTTASIVRVGSAAEADSINGLTFNPSNYSSRLTITVTNNFKFEDTTAVGQVRSYRVTVNYNVSIDFVWTGSQTTTETDSTTGGVSTKTVGYSTTGTALFSGSHTFTGAQVIENSWLVENSTLLGAGTGAIGLHSTNLITGTYQEGNLNGSTGTGATASGSYQDAYHYTATSSFYYSGNAKTLMYSNARQGVLARQDTGNYTIDSDPTMSMEYTGRKDLSPVDAAELFGIANISGPTGTGSSPPNYSAQSLTVSGSGSMSASGNTSGAGYFGIQTGLVEAYDGTKTTSVTYAGFDSLNSAGSTFAQSDSVNYNFASPERVAFTAMSLTANGSGGGSSTVQTNALLTFTDLPTTNPNDDTLTGGIVSTGLLGSSTGEINTTVALSSRGAYSTANSNSSSTPGSPAALTSLAESFLNSFTPSALVANGQAPAELNVNGSPVVSDDRTTTYYWNAMAGNSTTQTTSPGGSFNSQLTFASGGGVTLARTGSGSYLYTSSGSGRSSGDSLSVTGTAPIVNVMDGTPGTEPPTGANGPRYSINPANQSGNGAFAYFNSSDNGTDASHGAGSHSYGLTSVWTPSSSGGSPGSSAVIDSSLSGTVGTSTAGKVVTTGSTNSTSSSTIDSDVSDFKDGAMLVAYNRDGTAEGDHKFFSAVSVYKMAGGANGSGGGTSSSGTTLADGSKSNTASSAGNYQSLGSAAGRTFSFVDLDESFTAGSGSSSGGSNPDGGPLAGTANMNRTLKYSSTHSSPLRSTLGFSSDWDQTRKNTVKDAVDSNGGTPVDPDDPSTPKYTVAVGDKGSVSFSGSGGSSQALETSFEELDPAFSTNFDLHAWSNSDMGGEPNDIVLKGTLKSDDNALHVDSTTTSNVQMGLSFADGIKLTGNGTTTTVDAISGDFRNPSDILDERKFQTNGGGSRTETKKIAAGALNGSISNTITTTNVLENFGATLSLAAMQEEQVVTPGWLLLPSVKGTGKLTTDVRSAGTATYGSTVEDRVDHLGPARSPGGGLPTNDGGTSVHIRGLATVSNWDTNNKYVNTFLTDGSRTSQFTPTGGGWSVATVTTNGTHNYEWNGPDSEFISSGIIVKKLQDGVYNSRTEFWSNSTRSGSISKTFNPAGVLTAVSGSLTLTTDASGDAVASDVENVTKILEVGVSYSSIGELPTSMQNGAAQAGVFANTNGQPVLGTEKVTTQRSYTRNSEDNFESHNVKTWTPSLDGNGGVNFAKTDEFTNTVSGELTETDTRTLTNATLLPGYTGSSSFSISLTTTDDYSKTLSSAAPNNDPLDLGFSDTNNYRSYNYRGDKIDTRFQFALTSTPTGTNSFNDSPTIPLAGGPSALMQEPGGGGSGGGSQSEQENGWHERFTATQIEEFLKQGAAFERDGYVGVLVELDGVKKLAVYQYWAPRQGNHASSPARYAFHELISATATGAVGQNPAAEAAGLYFTSYVMIGGGVVSVALVPIGASAAIVAGGRYGLLIFGATEIGSEFSPIPIILDPGDLHKLFKGRIVARELAENLAPVGGLKSLANRSLPDADGYVIGRTKDLSPNSLRPGESRIDENMQFDPERGFQWNWNFQNRPLLEEAIKRGKPIRDLSPGDVTGAYLNAERSFLESNGWIRTIIDGEQWWIPPMPPLFPN